MDAHSLQIIFDSPTAVFRPGQTITGRVSIATSGRVKLRSRWNTSVIFIIWISNVRFFFLLSIGMQLKFKGKSKTSWTENTTRRNVEGKTEYYSLRYHAEEEYFKNKITLVGDGGKSKKLYAYRILFCNMDFCRSNRY